jgi:hypothetical protein
MKKKSNKYSPRLAKITITKRKTIEKDENNSSIDG